LILFTPPKDIGKGTGLGLYLNEEIIKKHGGRIEVHCEEGKCCEFEVGLPK
jgi:two-component system NtrC family sensor kinase